MAEHDNVENIPIDIHYNKLLDWLINRRHCNSQWQGKSLQVREKIDAALVDVPDVKEVTALTEGTYLNYFHCLKIVELLQATDSGKKNVFGQYSSQKMQDWANIVKLYEKDGMFLAESAQMLSRNVNYEIPALKKQLAKCHQTQEECTRKERDYANNAINQRKNYESACKKMGIVGKKIKTELASLVHDLPTEFDKIAKCSKQLEPTVLYYDQFITHIMGRDLSSESLKALKHVQSRGNTTTFEWKTGKIPDKVEASSILIDTTDEDDLVENPDDIDWIGEQETIDFGAEIDFGDIADITVESGGDEMGNGEINWEDDTTKHSVQVTESSEDGVAKGELALSMLENPDTRNMFLDDLFELEAFLNQRLVELKGDNSVLSDSQFQSAPESIQLDASQVTNLLEKVQEITQMLTNMRMQQLLLIRNSPRFVNRVNDNLKQILTLADKMNFLERQAVIRRKEALEEQKEVEPKLDIIIKKTKELQKQLQSEISKKYKGRPINIMGEINTI
ncbi:CDK5 regulatory subunit-associated protein 3 [Patella vulgata]|uniref:CDK5 regulatory subunit-associated protein 3 n=1 Tax=Patella vulgata TaxID=6465 RepID=UPI0024A965FA|nr:CDK5 regulatory subunit-associated protein 3 [Patella vulgata]XP_050404823.2 CDK5 regulatory subunit-associated protein 3 [Patella vulgata]